MQSPIDAFEGIYLLTYFWFYELKLEMYKSANWEKDTIPYFKLLYYYYKNLQFEFWALYLNPIRTQ